MTDQSDDGFLAYLASYLDEWEEYEISFTYATNVLLPRCALESGADDLGTSVDDTLRASTDFDTVEENNSNRSENAVESRSTEQVVDEPCQVAKNTRAAKRKLKYANKVKNEKKTLREQEQTLPAQLNGMQRSKKKRSKVDSKNYVDLPVWMAMALRQEQGRYEAEEQQQCLKSAVENRNKLIRDVEESLKEQVRYLNGATTPPTPVDLQADIALFEGYLQDMDLMYAQTDDVFSGYEVEESPLVPYRVGLNWKWIGGLQYSELLDVLPIPFSFKQTCSATWKSIVQSHGKEGRKHYSGVIDPDNTLAVNFRLVCPRKSGESVNLQVHFVTRRYVEPNRMVIVWKALTEGENKFAGMYSDETGWSVVRSNDSGEAAMMPTVMQTFVRCMPTHVRGGSIHDKDLAIFASVVMESGDEDGLETARLMESLVIDDSLDNIIAPQ